MKILVTGATGTVGGHVVRHLADQGQEVWVLVRDPAKARATRAPWLVAAYVLVLVPLAVAGAYLLPETLRRDTS